MTTLQLRNHVQDYDEWKAVFDRFERFRADHRVRSYRVLRHVDYPSSVDVVLDFDGDDDARAFLAALSRVWATPQSRNVLVAHEKPVLLQVVEDRVLAPT